MNLSRDSEYSRSAHSPIEAIVPLWSGFDRFLWDGASYSIGSAYHLLPCVSSTSRYSLPKPSLIRAGASKGRALCNITSWGN